MMRCENIHQWEPIVNTRHWSTCPGRTEITDIIHHKNSQILKPSSCPSPSLMTSLKYYWEPICQMCKSPQPSLIIPWTINIPGGDCSTGKSKSNSGRLSTAFDGHFALFTMSRGEDWRHLYCPQRSSARSPGGGWTATATACWPATTRWRSAGQTAITWGATWQVCTAGGRMNSWQTWSGIDPSGVGRRWGEREHNGVGNTRHV